MTNPTITQALERIACGSDLSAEDAGEVLAQIMDGRASDIEIAGFLIGLRTKGESVEEVAGLARTMRSLAVAVPATRADLIDTAGTGGGRPTFNVSTTAALIAAGAGCAVAKHGNRSATGLSGSADLLEALGANINLGGQEVATCIDKVGFGFMFAPAHHSATRYVVPVRKELAIRTVFNLLGPLTNPAGARRQLIGVSDPALIETVAGALVVLGVTRAMVVSSDDGLDELSTVGPTQVAEINGDVIKRYCVTPEEFGLDRADPTLFRAGDPASNAVITRSILGGQIGPERDLAVLNAGGAIYTGGRADTLEAGVRAAQAAVDTGAASAVLDLYISTSNSLTPSGR